MVNRVASGKAGQAARPDREVAMLVKFLAACGYPKADDIVDFAMTGVAKGAVTNNASVNSTETGLGYENAANNSVNETTTVRSKADMQVVSKTPSITPVNLRDNFNFVVKVRNNVGAGLAEADGIRAPHRLCPGLSKARQWR